MQQEASRSSTCNPLTPATSEQCHAIVWIDDQISILSSLDRNKRTTQITIISNKHEFVMTLNALFSAGGIPCLISDHLVTFDDHLVTGDEVPYLTRKSALISNDLVVAAAGPEVSACGVLEQLHDRFQNCVVTREFLFSFLADIKQYKNDPEPCVIIGWICQGRKKPWSFKWNTKHPSNPEVNRDNFLAGSGDIVFNDVTPPFDPMPDREPFANALSHCAERAGTLWVNEVVHRTLSLTRCGGGFEVYLRDPRVNAFRYADEIGCLYIPLQYKIRRGRLTYNIMRRLAYMKTSVNSIKLLTGALPHVRVQTIAIEPPHLLGINTTSVSQDTGLAAKLYACCFVAQDAKNGTILVDVYTAFGADAKDFNFDIIPGQSPDTGLLVSPIAPTVIHNMAKTATKRFQNCGLNLV